MEVDTIDGFSMLINKAKFEDQIFFDENFFLYLENTDLCIRQKNKNFVNFLKSVKGLEYFLPSYESVSYTHLRANETLR